MFLFALTALLSWHLSDITSDAPNHQLLNDHVPLAMTRVYAGDGQTIAEYSYERRISLPIDAIPDRLTAAVLSAEDNNFYRHSGVDYLGITRALFQNAASLLASGGIVGGASTITQQVARNLMLSPDQTWERKVNEAILAFRIEAALTKHQILELYLNDSYFGRGAYGVAAAALTYFDKAVQELTTAECAYLAALLKGPSNYHPYRHSDAALERRNWVIDRMVENGYVTADEGDAAKVMPLGVVDGRPAVFAADAFDDPYAPVFQAEYGEEIAAFSGIPIDVASYFAAEARREAIELLGQETVYGGGLSVRTSLDPDMQILARNVLMDGLVAYDEARGWRGPVDEIDVSGDWGPALTAIPGLSDVFEWRLAVVTDTSGDSVGIGLQPTRDPAGGLSGERLTGTIPAASYAWAGNVLEVGDVIFVEEIAPGTFRLRQKPEIEGAIVAMHPQTGRVLALVGGFSFSASQFNRATQAYRQPGSAFKPFVYAAALANGYTPASVILDAPIEIAQQGNPDTWRPQNYSRDYLGPAILRTGIELSRNVMTVRLSQEIGLPLVVDVAERFGIYDEVEPFPALALGAGETTLLRLTSAYAAIANGGVRVSPSFIDRIQDRYGNTIYHHSALACEECQTTAWDGQDEPVLVDHRERVIDAMTAYQLTSMMEGVVQRGTATVVRQLDHPIAGKTGTSNDFHDAWFVGFTPSLVVGVYIGYDVPRDLGTGNTGGVLAAPIFTEFMRVVLADKEPDAFDVPPGMEFVLIDRRTGQAVEAGVGGAVVEAFKPGTGPGAFAAIEGSNAPMSDPPVITVIGPARW